jgi:predicted nucleic acid-binding protein
LCGVDRSGYDLVIYDNFSNSSVEAITRVEKIVSKSILLEVGDIRDKNRLSEVFKKNVIKNAITLSLEKDLDLEDVLQCLCAKENGCEVLITHDKKFYDCGIEIMNCEYFLKNI